VNNLIDFDVLATFINGEMVADRGVSHIKAPAAAVINQFKAEPIAVTDLAVPNTGAETIPVIGALDGQLITERYWLKPLSINGLLESDVPNDVLKMVVVNRYNKAPIAKAFVKNFGLKQGALASSVAHDSHNIVAVGADDAALAAAINLVIAAGGGIAASPTIAAQAAQFSTVIALPVAGLMSNADGYAVAQAYTRVDQYAKTELGSTLQSPFMTLSFMALLVIPHLKLSDKGLFDGDAFAFVAG